MYVRMSVCVCVLECRCVCVCDGVSVCVCVWNAGVCVGVSVCVVRMSVCLCVLEMPIVCVCVGHSRWVLLLEVPDVVCSIGMPGWGNCCMGCEEHQVFYNGGHLCNGLVT